MSLTAHEDGRPRHARLPAKRPDVLCGLDDGAHEVTAELPNDPLLEVHRGGHPQQSSLHPREGRVLWASLSICDHQEFQVRLVGSAVMQACESLGLKWRGVVESEV